MTGIPFQRHWAQALIAAALAVGLMVVSVPASAAAQQTGQALLRSAENGRSCAKFSGRDFGQMGEVVMGRMAGSPSVHNAMEVQMRRMMGAGAERRVHAFLGRRFSGCGGALPAQFGPMMRAVGIGRMMGGSSAGMMGGPGYGHYGPGVMGGSRSGSSSGSGVSAAAAVLIAVFAALAGGGLVALYLGRRSTPHSA